MGTMMSWRPSWWSEEVHGSAWERAKEALRRDWMQTKRDLGVGGHEMNQSISDTVNQATGTQHLPTINEANPPKVIGTWDVVETYYRFGHAARQQYGRAHPTWNEGLEQKLKSEWIAAQDKAGRDWSELTAFVRRGYEHRDTVPTLPTGVAPPNEALPVDKHSTR